jgi:hypothetical protein
VLGIILGEEKKIKEVKLLSQKRGEVRGWDLIPKKVTFHLHLLMFKIILKGEKKIKRRLRFNYSF